MNSLPMKREAPDKATPKAKPGAGKKRDDDGNGEKPNKRKKGK